MLRVMSLLVTLVILLAVASCTAALSPNEADNPVAADEQAQIYAAAIRETHSLSLSSSLVYVLSTTEDLMYAEAPIAPTRKLEADLQDVVMDELDGSPFKLIWIEAFDEAPIDPANGEVAQGDGIIITLGNIHPQEDGSVQLSTFMTCADLCGTGKTYVLKEISGVWQITGSVGPEIAS